MKDQTVMVPLVELPGWLQAAGWGLLSASGLLIGAVGGYYTQLRHTTIARVMTFAAGVLFAVVAVDLVINARGATSLYWTVMGLLCGAAVFSSVNWLLSRRGAKHRKRCGECVEQPEEEQQPGSGLAIAAGTFLDGVPEGVVLGLSVLHQGAPGLGTVTAFFLANIPEALSSSAGMRRAGRSSALRVWRVDWNRLDDQPRSGGCRGRAPRHRASGPGDDRGVRSGRDSGAGLGNDDPGGIPRLATVQRSAARRRFCGLTDPARTQPLKLLAKSCTSERPVPSRFWAREGIFAFGL